MAAFSVLNLLLQSLILQLVGVEMDEAMLERMKSSENFLSWEMTQLLQNMEQKMQEPSNSAAWIWEYLSWEMAQLLQYMEKTIQKLISSFAWLFSTWKQWQLGAIAGVLLLLLLGLFQWLRKRSHQPESSWDVECYGSSIKRKDRGKKEELEEKQSKDEGEGLSSDMGLEFSAGHSQWPAESVMASASQPEEEEIGEQETHQDQVMALTTKLSLVVLGIVQMLLMFRSGTCATVGCFLWYCFEQLIQLIFLLQEINYYSPQDKKMAATGALLLVASRFFWPVAADLVLHFCICCLFWKWICETGSSRKYDISRRLEEEEEEEEEYETEMDKYLDLDTDEEEEEEENEDEDEEEEEEKEMGEEEHLLFKEKYIDLYVAQPINTRRKKFIMVENLVNQLLCVCQRFSLNEFKPWLQPAVQLSDFHKGCESDHGEDDLYHLLVPLKPPPGHSFHLQDSTEGHTSVRNSRFCVSLECMCTREQVLGDMLCFLHHPEEELRSRQGPSLLQTLCTKSTSYLDVKKTAHWLQQTVIATYLAMCPVNKWELTVMPSNCSCSLKLVNTFDKPIFIELIMAVQQDTSGTYVTME